MFFSCRCEFGKEGTRKSFILLSWLCTLNRKLKDRHGKNSYFLLVCCQLSHISTAVSRESEVFQPFTVPSSSLGTVQEETRVSLYSLPLLAELQSSLVAQRINHLPAMRETQVRSLGWEDPLEKEMATHSSILVWRSPWTEEPGRLQSTGLQRVGHDWASSLSL